jgi:hypothetical protein
MKRVVRANFQFNKHSSSIIYINQKINSLDSFYQFVSKVARKFGLKA